MIEVSFGLIGREVKIISPNICLHYDMKHTIVGVFSDQSCLPMLPLSQWMYKSIKWMYKSIKGQTIDPERLTAKYKLGLEERWKYRVGTVSDSWSLMSYIRLSLDSSYLKLSSAEVLFFDSIQRASMSLNICDVVWVSNSLDPSEASSY